LKAWTDTAALAAPITPEDVAEAVWWLGAGAAKTTGEVLLLDAGFRITKG
jgi:enoyl-[acyl-carrier-protein] reductase (NADH)